MVIVVIVLIALMVVSYGFWRWNTNADIIHVSAPLPDNFPDKGFSHQSIENLLQQFITPQGRIDYQKWYENKVAVKKLDRYLSALALYSPENSPERFKEKNQALVYWVYSYNALVIKSILKHWPLESVMDVKAPVEIIKGLGFFYKLKFVLGGELYNLYQIEARKIFDGENDPRIHFVLNCGSEGCPVMRPQLPMGEELEPFLATASSEFLKDKKNLSIDDEKKIVHVSIIFDWYKKDFLDFLQQQNPDANILDYLKSISTEPEKSNLIKARNYQLIFSEYDWTLNNKKPLNEESIQ